MAIACGQLTAAVDHADCVSKSRDAVLQIPLEHPRGPRPNPVTRPAVDSSIVRRDEIVLDIAMPGMDGVTGLRGLRALKPDVPVTVLTANADQDVGRSVLRSGAFNYIGKPFTAAH